MISRNNIYKKDLDSKTRVKLIREGNKHFSKNNIKTAERIFITVDYKDGLVRLGDYYYEHNNILKAAEMYFLSGSSLNINKFCEKSASIIHNFLEEDKKTEKIQKNKKYNKIIIDNNNNKK